MGKKGKKRKSRGGGGDGATSTWDGADHAMRQEQSAIKKAKKQQKRAQNNNEASESRQEAREERRVRLTAKLTHDSQEKREASKLRLNITKTQRDLEKLRQRLSRWDDAEEEKRLKEEEAAELKRQQDAINPPKKRGRLGPESWKLKGAARPAWMVCEFDVRYECPHQKAHDQAKAKAKRIRNLLAIYKGNFGNMTNDTLSYPHRRQFLALLMQHGLLNLEAKRFKTARLSFLECLDLDGIDNPITDARCYLMRLYLQVNRPQSVHQLWTTRLAPASGKETSAWVLYSVALVEYVRWKEFQEATREEAETAMARALKGNAFCGFNLSFCDFFRQHMEYTDEIEDADNPLEEAIEYCDSEQMGMWMGTDGALEWAQATLLRVLHGQGIGGEGTIQSGDMEWTPKLASIEEDCKNKKQQMQETNDDESDGKSLDEMDEGEHPDRQVDTLMYCGMFRTTMEMLYDSGALSQAPPMIVDDEPENEAADNTANDAGMLKSDAQQVSEEGNNSEDSDSNS